MSERALSISIARHPWLPGRWTHLVLRAEALKVGWMTTGNLPLGSWPSRSGAARHARKLTATGRFVLNMGARP